mmetsp:Transcript_45654/g.138415  ORF Transcript_45654/g.138415 Transcript_45654/m.138415 type:complete len:247 (-) Transcript_45654:834-1574(-)
MTFEKNLENPWPALPCVTTLASLKLVSENSWTLNFSRKSPSAASLTTFCPTTLENSEMGFTNLGAPPSHHFGTFFSLSMPKISSGLLLKKKSAISAESATWSVIFASQIIPENAELWLEWRMAACSSKVNAVKVAEGLKAPWSKESKGSDRCAAAMEDPPKRCIAVWKVSTTNCPRAPNVCFATLHCSAGPSGLNRVNSPAKSPTCTWVRTGPRCVFFRNPRARRSVEGAFLTARTFNSCNLEAPF